MKHLFSVESRVVMLTGATGHLGQAIAIALAKAGACLVLNARNGDELSRLKEKIEEAGGQGMTMAFDVCDDAAVQTAVCDIERKYGRLDVLVNNAYSGGAGTMDTATAQDFSRSYEVTVTASAMLAKAALPLLQRSSADLPGGASIINMASMYGVVSPDLGIYQDASGANPPFYGAAKAGLLQLTRYMAVQYAPFNIRVNAICPGPFPAPGVQKENPEFIDRLQLKLPMKRIGQPDELVGPVIFLSSEASSYMTGATIPVDGGWTAW